MTRLQDQLEEELGDCAVYAGAGCFGGRGRKG
jgi:hypothetical protein